MSVAERLKEIAVCFLVILCGIPLVPVVVLAWIWKTIVQITVSIIYKNLNLTLLDVFTSIYFYGEERKNFHVKTKRVILVNIVLDGQLCLDEVRQRVQQNAIEARGSDGTLTFLRLQQRLFEKLGYAFLGLDPNFNIANHINEMQVSLNQDSLYDFIGNRSTVPFRADQPFWEILLVPNYNGENKTFILIRLHHTIMDGHSLVYFVKAISDNGQTPLEMLPANSLSHSPTKFERLTKLYKRTIALPRTYFLEKSTRPITPTFSGTEIGYFNVINKIPLQKFKDFQKRTNVSLTEAIFYAISCAMTEGCILPKTINAVVCATTLPLPTTGKKNGNNFYFTDVNLPVGSLTLEQRVQKCQAELQKTKNSVSTIVNGMKFIIGALFPISVFVKYFPAPNFFMSMSNTPGPVVPLYFFGCYPLDVFIYVPPIDSPAIIMLPLSYNGDLIISLAGIPGIFSSKEKFVKFVDHFENELNTLLVSSPNLPSIQPNSMQVVEEI